VTFPGTPERPPITGVLIENSNGGLQLGQFGLVLAVELRGGRAFCRFKGGMIPRGWLALERSMPQLEGFVAGELEICFAVWAGPAAA
jgi:hypothetical protein